MSAADQHRRLAVTGIGIVSPIGIGRETFWKNLESLTTGVTKLGYGAPNAPGSVGAAVSEFTEESAKKEYLKGQRKSLKVMCRDIQLGVAAALQAVEDSRLDISKVNNERVGVEYGANLMFFNPETMADSCRACSNETGDFEFENWGSQGLSQMEPLWMLRYLPNMPACHIAIFTDARGPNNSVTLDEASPGVALTEAMNIMQRGAADVMLVGGTGTLVHPVRAIHSRLYDRLGYDEAEPLASCRPFDQRRTGQVGAEAAACLVIEDEAHAQERGATIYGYLLGGGSSCVSRPDGTPDIAQAIVNACRSALRRAGIEPSELGHVNAHGIGSPEGDRAEAAGLREVLGAAAASVPVVGLKGYFGNSGAATGFVELTASLLSTQAGHAPATLNCEQPDASLELNLPGPQKLPVASKKFLKVNYTRAGQASAVVMEGA